MTGKHVLAAVVVGMACGAFSATGFCQTAVELPAA